MESEEIIKQNLLIIDDEVEITKTLHRQFRRKYNVFTTNNATDAFPILEKENIQVVLSDQRMPGITGIDFFKKIKDKYPDALKLILSGYSDIEAVIGAINEGQVFRYLTKPWNPMELELVVEEAFEKYELITKNRRLMKKLEDINLQLEEKVKARTRELETANQKLTALNIEKNKYVGMVAHDLRNPIGIALSFSDLLINEFDSLSKTEIVDFSKIINERCSFAVNLISQFLDVSKIEAGTFELNLEKHNYVDFVKNVVGRNSLLAKNKSQKISFKTDIPEIEFAFDKDKIEQVLSNIISNAIKFSMPYKKISVEIYVENGNVITRVIDEGQGIPKGEIEHIFNPYLATSVKSTAGEKSTGLGLAIVKKIVDAHQGEIKVESSFGKGSVFTVILPKK
ncbi:MAG: hybrid sensor histidine kinase/response regulator [Prolixibacteraceae bacterium]|nr:hybrid sensor histidine kinase/response regulator [Prolixibacteraceae bacterium]